MLAARERPEQHRGRSTNSHSQLESLLISLDSGFVDRVVRLVTDEMAIYRARRTDVVASAFDNLGLDARSILELFSAAELGGRLSTANPETSKMPSFMLLVPGSD